MTQTPDSQPQKNQPQKNQTLKGQPDVVDPDETQPAVADEPPTPAGSDLARRVEGLSTAAELVRGKIDDEVLAPADALTDRAAGRLRLSSEHTIVALAGATGSGKSSLFNALTDMQLAGTGVRRPTTSWALACSWGPEGAEELLEWMGIPPRHQVSRVSMLDRSSADTKLDGLVLLDLPDHDSTEVAHHLEMDRLVKHSDMLVWVLDPQKYADAAIHERYIRPMATFSDVTVVVLNQIDRIPYEHRQQAIDDVRRLVAEDGVKDARIFAVSATRGDGIDDLKRELATQIRTKGASLSRLKVDVHDAASTIEAAAGSAAVPTIGDGARERLNGALADSAGVPQLGAAIAADTVRRARQYTSWPVLRVLSRKKDQSDGLGLGDDYSAAALARSVTPEAGQVQRARTDLVVRETVDEVSGGLARPWRAAIGKAMSTDVTGALDDAISGTDLAVKRTPLWWRLVQVVQWLLLLAAVVGLVFWGVQAADAQFDLGWSLPEVGETAGISRAAWGAMAALAAGLVLDLVSRAAARSSSKRRAQRAEAALRASIASVAEATVLTPLGEQVDQYRRYHEGLHTALA